MIAIAACCAALAAALVTTAVLPPATARTPGVDPPHASRSEAESTATPWTALRLRRDRAVTPSAVAAWADDLARQLRHGSTLHAAVADVQPRDRSLTIATEPLRHWLERGTSVADACDEWGDDLGERSAHDGELLTTTAAVLAATATLGGTSAAPLDRLAAAMRHRASADLERQAHSAQARLSANVLTLVPIATLGLLLATDADVRDIVTEARGAGLIAFGLALNALGSWWMRRIARRTRSVAA